MYAQLSHQRTIIFLQYRTHRFSNVRISIKNDIFLFVVDERCVKLHFRGETVKLVRKNTMAVNLMKISSLYVREAILMHQTENINLIRVSYDIPYRRHSGTHEHSVTNLQHK